MSRVADISDVGGLMRKTALLGDRSQPGSIAIDYQDKGLILYAMLRNNNFLELSFAI